MKQTRRGVFETNSSSTHSLTMCSKEDFEAWKKGEVIFLNSYKSTKFVPVEEAMDKLKKNYPDTDLSDESDVNANLRDMYYYTYESYFNENDFETFTDKFETKGGEVVMSFGCFGSDR